MNITKVAIITIAWILVNVFITFYNHIFITSHLSLGPSAAYNFKFNLLTNMMIGLIAGLTGGSILVYLNGYLFRKKCFGYALFITAVSYYIVFQSVAVIPSYFSAIHIQNTVDPEGKLITLIIQNLTDKIPIINFFLWGSLVLMTLFLLQVNDKFGPGILWKFIMGEFHIPKQVDRIFMFLDMKSSTTVAEKLGNEKYFDLLSNCFTDITTAIIICEGEIYQYVGDEIVISWPMRKGRQNSNCIKCFFEIQKTLNTLAPLYKKKFGHSPEFKAGLHCGTVTAGEIGQIKRDIVFSGDILNTTSRIQDQCNKHNVSFLASEDIIRIIEDHGNYNFIPLGEIELKGKQKKVSLNAVNKYNK